MFQGSLSFHEVFKQFSLRHYVADVQVSFFSDSLCWVVHWFASRYSGAVYSVTSNFKFVDPMESRMSPDGSERGNGRLRFNLLEFLHPWFDFIKQLCFVQNPFSVFFVAGFGSFLSIHCHVFCTHLVEFAGEATLLGDPDLASGG